MGKIIAICSSDMRGVQKQPRDTAWLDQDWGIRGVELAGHCHR